jgi:hypothetical protein
MARVSKLITDAFAPVWEAAVFERRSGRPGLVSGTSVRPWRRGGKAEFRRRRRSQKRRRGRCTGRGRPGRAGGLRRAWRRSAPLGFRRLRAPDARPQDGVELAGDDQRRRRDPREAVDCDVRKAGVDLRLECLEAVCWWAKASASSTPRQARLRAQACAGGSAGRAAESQSLQRQRLSHGWHSASRLQK